MGEDDKIWIIGLVTNARPAVNDVEETFLLLLQQRFEGERSDLLFEWRYFYKLSDDTYATLVDWLHFYSLYSSQFEQLRRMGEQRSLSEIGMELESISEELRSAISSLEGCDMRDEDDFARDSYVDEIARLRCEYEDLVNVRRYLESLEMWQQRKSKLLTNANRGA